MAVSRTKERLDQAHEYLRGHDPAAALKIFETQLSIDDYFKRDISSLKIYIARCYIDLERVDEAIKLLETIESKIKTAHALRDFYKTFSRCYEKKYLKSKDKTFLEKAIKNIKEVPNEFEKEKQLSYAHLLRLNNKPSEALAIIDRFLEKNPDDKDALLVKMSVIGKISDHEMQFIVNGIDEEKNVHKKISSLHTLVRHNQKDSHLTFKFEQVLSEHKVSGPKIQHDLAMSYANQNEQALADYIFLDLIKKDPTFWQAQISYCHFMQKNQGAYDESVTYLHEILNFDRSLPKWKQPTIPQLTQVYHKLAIAHYECGRDSLCDEAVNNGLKLEPMNAMLLSMKAKLIREDMFKSVNKQKHQLFNIAKNVDNQRWRKNHDSSAVIVSSHTNHDDDESHEDTSAPMKKHRRRRKNVEAPENFAECDTLAAADIQQSKREGIAEMSHNISQHKNEESIVKKPKAKMPKIKKVAKKTEPDFFVDNLPQKTPMSICNKIGLFASAVTNAVVTGSTYCIERVGRYIK